MDSRGTTKYQYDNLNRAVLITQPTNLSVAYQWDANSNRTLMTTTAGGTNTTTRYGYDGANRLITVTDNLNANNIYSYDTSGLRSGLVLNNGANAINVSYGYDALSRLRNITQTQGITTVATYSYTLDAVGNRKQVDETGGNYSKWLYDDSNRLISETRQVSGTITSTLYTYDKTGNRLQQTLNGSSVMTGTYNELDQLISDGTKQYTYDHRGNLTQITGGTKYKWDGADRLISATVGSNTALYTYDADGRRVKQSLTTTSTVTTNFLWDEMSPYGNVVYESDGTNSTNYTLGNGELLSQKRSSSTTEYFLMDGHSGVRNLASNTGSVLQNYNYDAFGNLQNFSGTPNTKYLYTGQQFDSLTSLYDLRARYYNPTQGRFLSRDVAGLDFNNPKEFNRYGYTANNPVNFGDPSGLKSTSISKGGGSEYGTLIGTIIGLGLATTVGVGRLLGYNIEDQLMRLVITFSWNGISAIFSSLKKEIGNNRFTVSIALTEMGTGSSKFNWFITINIGKGIGFNLINVYGFIAQNFSTSFPIHVGVGSGDDHHAEPMMEDLIRQHESEYRWPQDISALVANTFCPDCFASYGSLDDYYYARAITINSAKNIYLRFYDTYLRDVVKWKPGTPEKS